MDAISGGAGVIAFITIALQSTKIIYKAISNIKDGPREIRQIASAVSNLQVVLTQLSNCPAVKSADSETDLVEISRLIKICTEDLSHYERDIRKIQISPDDKKAGKAWKKINTVLRKKDIQEMWKEVNHHVTTLGLQLNIIQS